MSEPTTELSESATHWLEFTRQLGEAGLRIHAMADGKRTPTQHQEINRTLLLGLSLGALYQSRMDPDYPDWLPFANSAYNHNGSNADNVYLATRIHGYGTYRITGNRGTVGRVFLQIDGGLMGYPDYGAAVGGYDLDDFDIGEDGTFELILSPVRPEGYTGNWAKLNPDAPQTFLLLRQISRDWLNETDGRFTIQRIDVPLKPPLRIRDIDQRISQVPSFVEETGKIMLQFMAWQNYDNVELNKIEDYTDKFGGLPLVKNQGYLGGRIKLDPDEALIVEVAIPEGCTYWNTQLMDSFWGALDFMFHSVSYNISNAHIDSDGILRLVVSEQDPGVPNWLDKGDHDVVTLRLRWLGADNVPPVTTKRVPVTDVRKHMLPDTPTVSFEQRQDKLRQRIETVQKRARW